MALDFSLTDQQSDLQRRAREEFAAVRERHGKLRANERQAATLDEVWSTLAGLGFHGSLVPERYQGSATGLVGAAIVMEELAAQGLHSFRPILLSMGAAAIAGYGAEALKQEELPRICSGDRRLAIASTEEEAGFNVLNARTFAERQGEHYVVNGSKIYVSGLDIADAMLLVTRTTAREKCERKGLPKTAGLTLLLVDVKSEGVCWEPVPSRGEGVMTQFALSLTDVRVPARRLIGEEDGGAAAMFQMFNPERTLASAMALGMSRYCLELACAHARRRKVFGETPIGAYQSVQHPLGEIAIRLESVRLAVRRAAWLFDQRGDRQAQSESANSAKYLASELAIGAVDAAIDTFGGKGFDEDHGIIHLWEAARLLKTAPISNALILNQTAERVLGLPRSY
jgi:alkylation response protein AidB-like acyl-CoA dehydrogenase